MSTRSYQLPAEPIESRETFDCFGGSCTVIVADARRPADAADAVANARRRLLDWHRRFSRFERDSELSRFNRDPRTCVPVSPMLRLLIDVALAAAVDTGGLVDAALGAEIERAGYSSHFHTPGIGLEPARTVTPAGPGPVAVTPAGPGPVAVTPAGPGPVAVTPAGPGPIALEQRIAIDPDGLTVSRRPGTSFDPGGIAKGVFADQLAVTLAGFDAFAVDCAGDVRLGGQARVMRPVHVTSPFDDQQLHTFMVSGGGIATSGITKRSWIGPDGSAAHHLLDPRTGRPAFTGVVQATALAPTAAQAEALAKAALLSGPEDAPDWLRWGGAFVRDDGSYEVLEPAAAPEPTRAASQRRISASTSSRSGSFRISW